MIKLVDILSESTRVKLSPDTLAIINRVVELIFKKRKNGFKKYTPITSIPIMVADGSSGTVEISIDPDLKYYGILDTKVEDSTDPNDFIIKINPNKIKSKKGLYQTIYHEIMHATDPNFSTKYTEDYWSDYDPDFDEKYWGHPIEFRAITNEFIEGLMNEFKLRRKRLTNKNSIISLKKSLNNILNHFATGEPLSPLSSDIIHSMYGSEEINNNFKKVLKDIVMVYPDVADIIKKEENLDYMSVINLVKQYSGEDWKRFLGMLVKASDEIKETL
jgi:hypothetical protein